MELKWCYPNAASQKLKCISSVSKISSSKTALVRKIQATDIVIEIKSPFTFHMQPLFNHIFV